MLVRSPEAGRLADAIRADGVECPHRSGAELLELTGLDARVIGRRTAGAGIVLYELTPKAVSMEQAFMDLTRDAVDYPAHLIPTDQPSDSPADLAQPDRSAA